MNMRLCAMVAVLAVASAAWSQPLPPPEGANDAASGLQRQPPPSGGNEAAPGLGMRLQVGQPRGDAMMENFFEPELVMRHQKEIALTADQQGAIRAEMLKTVPKFMDLQWQQSAEEEALQTLVKQDRPDERQVLAQLDKLLAVENDLKRTQLGMLVRIKNVLTPEQQAKLTELRKRMERRMMLEQQGDRRGGDGEFRRGGPEGAPQRDAQPGSDRGTKTPRQGDQPSRGEGG